LLHAGNRLGVLPTNVDEALGGSDSISSKDHAFYHKVGASFKKKAVFERSWFTFIGVANEVLRFTRRVARKLPFSCSGKTCSPASTQARVFDRGENALGGHTLNSKLKTLVPALFNSGLQIALSAASQ